MKVKPWNRRLLVEMVEVAEEQASAILLPEDYKPNHEYDYHIPARVLAGASDATLSLVGKQVILQSSGIEEFKVNGEMHYLVLENYIVCVLEE